MHTGQLRLLGTVIPSKSLKMLKVIDLALGHAFGKRKIDLALGHAFGKRKIDLRG